MKYILITCIIIIILLVGFSMYNAFYKESYRTIKLNHIHRRVKKKDEPHSLKYRGHRYDRKHQRR